MDSDCVADPLWLKQLVPLFTDPAVGAVGGAVDAHFDHSALDRYEKVRSPLNMGRAYKSSREGGLFFYVPSCNLLVRKEPFLSLGGFREQMHLGEDVDLCWRLQDTGYQIEYRPFGKVFHKHRNNLSAFCARRFDYGTSEPSLQRLHPRRIKRLNFPPAMCLFWALLALSAFLWNPLPFFSCGIILVFDGLNKLARTSRRGIVIGFSHLLLAVFRSYLAFLHSICAFVSRYYFAWSLFILPLSPLVSASIVGMHLVAGLVDFLVKKPHLNLFAYLFYFSGEQVSYQLGVWGGCLTNLRFNSVNPRLSSTSALGDI
jgi:mycofactocin system glycosyltransferase